MVEVPESLVEEGRKTVNRLLGWLGEQELPGIRARLVKRAVTVSRPVHEVYAFWQDAEAPLVLRAAEIVEERTNESISWRTVEGTTIPASGTLRFVPAPAGQGTEVHAEVEYRIPGGMPVAKLAEALGREPGGVDLGEQLRQGPAQPAERADS